MDDFRPHLLIPETEVDYIEPPPPRGPKKEDVDHVAHGSVLSSGLQEIVTAYTKVQSAGSLRDEDIRVFEVILPEGEKFSNKTLRDFIEAEGMTIKNVHNERRATVVTSASRFGTLRDRIDRYRKGERVNKNFRDIEGFRFPDPTDKQSPSIKERFLQEVGSEVLDVEIREENLLNELGINGQIRIEQKLMEGIRAQGGEIRSEPYLLSDDTRILRAGVTLDSLQSISEDPLVSHIAPTAFYATAPAYCIPSQGPLTLNSDVDIEELPIVAVLDDGIDFPDTLSPVIVEHWTPLSATPGGKTHGTNVASKVAFADTGAQINLGIMTPRARIVDCNICGPDPESTRAGFISNPTMIKRIKEAVLRYKDITKIFNFSYADDKPIEGDKISNLGYELDVLALNYGVQFIISAGNHDLYRTQTSLEDILSDDDARIASPSDSMLNITVGAVVGQDHIGSLSKRYDVAPYSRIGPGFHGMRKPDIVAYGGTMLKTGKSPADDYSLMLAAGNRLACEAGTSFTAPVIAGDLAQISMAIPNRDIFLAKTLLYHGTDLPIDAGKNKVRRDEAAFYGDLYGRGLPCIEESMYSTANKVTFLHSGTMNKKHKQHVKFLLPKVCDDMDMSKRKAKIKVTVTCVTQSPIDSEKGTDYLQAYVNASIHSINGTGKMVSSNPSETDGRKKWDTCFHFETPYSSFQSGDWEIWLELHSRYDVTDEQDIAYSLAITVEDLTQELNLYDSIVAEAQGRFPAVQMVRLPVRT